LGKEEAAIDKIYVNQMSFYGYHGVFPEENKLGQRFFIDLVVELDLQKAGKTDDLTNTVNYADLYQICKEFAEEQTFQLIEALAENIAQEILNRFSNIYSCTVKVYKPDPPIKGYYQSVAVEIKRSR
jgi:7,8-dihydroneopterin aldolase/epimerase/oxygenase